MKTIGRVTISHDPFTESPRTYDNMGIMATGTPRNGGFGDAERAKLVDTDAGSDVKVTLKDGRRVYWRDIQRGVVDGRRVIALRVYVYSHSGDFYFTEAYEHIHTIPDWQWDVGFVGYIFAYEDDALEAFGRQRMSDKLRQQIRKSLQSEIAEYSAWANGDTYFISIETAKVDDDCDGEWGDDLPWETQDSCGGFIDVNNYVTDQARSDAQRLANDIGVPVPIMYDDQINEVVEPTATVVIHER